MAYLIRGLRLSWRTNSYVFQVSIWRKSSRTLTVSLLHGKVNLKVFVTCAPYKNTLERGVGT